MRTKHILLIAGLMITLQDVSALPVRDSLAMIETGAPKRERSKHDTIRGASGEVSRYQIMPGVWHQYAQSRNYEDPDVAWTVAQRIIKDRRAAFQRVTGRAPKPLELYLLWNKPGHFASVGYDCAKVRTIFLERAQRFANLVESTD